MTSNFNESGSAKVYAAVCSRSDVRNFGLAQTRKCHSSLWKDPSPALLINNKEITWHYVGAIFLKHLFESQINVYLHVSNVFKANGDKIRELADGTCGGGGGVEHCREGKEKYKVLTRVCVNPRGIVDIVGDDWHAEN